MVNLKYFLLISAVILFVYVFYKWLTRYLRRNDINIKFTYLFPFEGSYICRKGNVKIDIAVDGFVRAEVVRENGELVMIAFEEQLKSGICNKEIDFTPVASGSYIFRIVLADQTITRYIRVNHEG